MSENILNNDYFKVLKKINSYEEYLSELEKERLITNFKKNTYDQEKSNLIKQSAPDQLGPIIAYEEESVFVAFNIAILNFIANYIIVVGLFKLSGIWIYITWLLSTIFFYKFLRARYYIGKYGVAEVSKYETNIILFKEIDSIKELNGEIEIIDKHSKKIRFPKKALKILNECENFPFDITFNN